MISSIVVLGFLIFGAIVYAISKGYIVKAAMTCLGTSLTFEAQKDKPAVGEAEVK
jgi:hypothetical protein